MFFGTLKDGGEFYIDNETIKKWKAIYPKVDVIHEIIDLYHKESYSKLSKRAALKLINKTLKAKNK